MNQKHQNKYLDVDGISISTDEINDDPQRSFTLSSTSTPENGATQERIYLDVVKYYYQTILKYPHIYSGLQFGCHYVLYRDHPQVVHSTYAIYVIHPTATTTDCANGHTNIPWSTIQTLVRMMADLHKTLILLHIEELPANGMSEERLQSPGPTQICSEENVCTTAMGATATHELQLQNTSRKLVQYPFNGKSYFVSELTITTEHAPFRQQQQQNNVSKVA